MPKQKSACLYYMATKNNPVPTDHDDLKKIPHKYIIWQLERGEKGTPHLQIYIALAKPMRITALNKLFKAHYEPRYGTHEQAKAYCSKEDTREEGPWTSGSDEGIPNRGQRTDLEAVKMILDSGCDEPIKKVQQNYFSSWVKYYKAFDIYHNQNAEQRDPNVPPKVIILWGDRGTGKSKKAFEIAPPPKGYWLTKPADPNQVWFDGYSVGQTLVIDEFYGWIKYEFMLRLIDRYPMDVKIHGSKIIFNSPLIIITSNRDPREWYGFKKDPLNPGERVKDPYFDTSAWERRLDTFCDIYHYKIGEPEPEVQIPVETGTDDPAINTPTSQEVLELI